MSARGAAVLALLAALGMQPTALLQAAEPVPRVEAKSSDLLAVGVVHGTRMSIHLSRVADNAPVRDALLSVVLRGAAHPARAETDGSYLVDDPALALPGASAVEFQVSEGTQRESLKGTLDVPQGTPADNKSSVRQGAWWILNFAVCIGFLLLWSRRRKDA